LHARGVKQLGVANRTQAHAIVLAQRWGGRAFDLDHLGQAMASVDIVITSTGAPYPIVSYEQVQTAMHSRPDRPLVLIDIAVPRDVEAATAGIPGVRLFNMDDMQSRLDESVMERSQQAPLVEAIINQEMAEFESWLRGAEVNPVISDLRKKAEAIRQNELDRALRHLAGLDPKDLEYIQGLSRALVNKLLHEPTSRLRAAAHRGDGSQYAESVRYLFGLSHDEPWRSEGADE
jgi:glutamyl-tRNA reductase